MIITTQGLDVEVTSERLNTMPPALLVTAVYDTVRIAEPLTFGPNTPNVPTSPEEMQAVVDAFRQSLADRVATQYNLQQMLQQVV